MRRCEACGAACKGKKVWAKCGKRVICMACGACYGFGRTGRLLLSGDRREERRLVAEGLACHIEWPAT
jgi:hypothetical protein